MVLYKSVAKKCKDGLALSYENKARVLEEIQEIQNMINQNTELVKEYITKGRRDLGRKYALQIAKANERLDILKEEASTFDDLAINLRNASRELDSNRQRDYKKIKKIVKKVIYTKEKNGPLKGEEKTALEEVLGNLNRISEREINVRNEMRDTYYTPSSKLEKEAEEYMKKIDNELRASNTTAAGLERTLGNEKLDLS